LSKRQIDENSYDQSPEDLSVELIRKFEELLDQIEKEREVERKIIEEIKQSS